MYELSAAVFQCGARGFNDLLMLTERIRLVRLFVFLLQIACECNAEIALETVVDAHDYTVVNKKKISSHSVVLAYRLWIPLDNTQEIAFLYAVSAAVANLDAPQMSGRDSTWFKRRRMDLTPDPMTLPEYARAVASTSELTELIRLYFMGTRKIDKVVGSETSEETTQSLSDVLCAQSQFKELDFLERGKVLGVWDTQMDIGSYVSRDGPFFSPNEDVIPLIRVFRCGSDGSFINLGIDIFK